VNTRFSTAVGRDSNAEILILQIAKYCNGGSTVEELRNEIRFLEGEFKVMDPDSSKALQEQTISGEYGGVEMSHQHQFFVGSPLSGRNEAIRLW
jgi:hypothetical protein